MARVIGGCRQWREPDGWSRTAVVVGLAMLLSLLGGLVIAKAEEGIPAELRVGIATNYPPLAFKENGQLQGVEQDFAKRLGQALGVHVQVVETPWDQLIPDLTAGKIDVIMSGFSITEERAKTISFTVPYFEIGQMAVIRRADEKRWRDPATMNVAGCRVGVVGRTTGAQFAQTHLGKASVKTFPDVDSGIAALRAGAIDVFVHDAPAIWKVRGGLESADKQLKGLYTPLTEEYLAWAVRKQDQALRERLDAVLLRWKRDGVVDDVLDNWITVRKRTIKLKPGAD